MCIQPTIESVYSTVSIVLFVSVSLYACYIESVNTGYVQRFKFFYEVYYSESEQLNKAIYLLSWLLDVEYVMAISWMGELLWYAVNGVGVSLW